MYIYAQLLLYINNDTGIDVVQQWCSNVIEGYYNSICYWCVTITMVERWYSTRNLC